MQSGPANPQHLSIRATLARVSPSPGKEGANQPIRCSESRSAAETQTSEVMVGELPSPTCPPLIQVFALSGELEDSGVAVAVRHEDAASLGVDRHVGGLAEVAAVASGNESLPEGQQDSVSAVTADLEHLRRKPANSSASCQQPPGTQTARRPCSHVHSVGEAPQTYLVERHVSQPVVVILVCRYSMRQVEPAAAADTFMRGPGPGPGPGPGLGQGKGPGPGQHLSSNNSRTYMFLPEAFSTEPLAGSTTNTVDC